MIQEINRKLTNSEMLRNNLWMESVITPTPLPYGSFQKAKYLLYMIGNYREPIYFFTTTCRNTEDCIDIMVQRWNPLSRASKYFIIKKVQNGIIENIYTNRPIDKP